MGVIIRNTTSGAVAQCADPVSVWTAARANSWPVEHWLGKPSSMRCLLGTEPGQGFVLLSSFDFHSGAQIDRNALFDLSFNIDPSDQSPQSVTLKSLVMVRATNITPGVRDDYGAHYLVELADRRWLYKNVPIDAAYNLRASAAADSYLTNTLNDGAVWTWATMLADIWETVGVSRLGAFPSLPFTPDGTPEGFSFYCMSALDALGIVLERLECSLKLDLLTDAFSIVQLGATDTEAEDALSRLDTERCWDDEPVESVRARIPAAVRICFRKMPVPQDGTSPYTTLDALDVTADAVPSGQEAGTLQLVHDDLHALYDDSGNLLNLTEITARAVERSADFWRSLHRYQSRMHRVFIGPQDESGLTAGSIIMGTCWEDRGQGFKTEVVRGPKKPKAQPPAVNSFTVQDTRYCTELAETITFNATTMVVTGAAQFPAAPFSVAVDQEIMTVTAGEDTLSWTVTRGAGGTTAVPHFAGAPVCWFTGVSDTLDGGINDSVTTLSIFGTGSFPSSGRFYIQIDDETMLVTGGAGSFDLTVVRGIAGAAAAHSNGTPIYQVLPNTVRPVRHIVFKDGFVQPGHTSPDIAVHQEVTAPVEIVSGPDITTGYYFGYKLKLNITTGLMERDYFVYIKDING